MGFNFDQIINRKGSDSVKWEFVFDHGTITPRTVGDNILDPDELLALWVADMDFASPPAVVEALCKRAEHGVFGYSMPHDSYHDAIINWMQTRHGWTVEKDWIMTVPGVVPTLNFIVQTYTQPGDKVVIQTPVYSPFSYAIVNNGRQVVHNPMVYENTRYNIDFDDLENKLADPDTTLAILCSPHNPVGRVWTKEELRRYAELCVKHNVLIVSDEIHHDLILPWGDFTTMGNAAPELMDHVIVCTAPSKTFNIPGLKTANCFIPNAELRGKLQAFMGNLGLFGANAFGIVALRTAYSEGAEWLDACMEYVGANYEFMRDYIAEHMPQLDVVHPEGTYLVWVDFNALGIEPDRLNQMLMEDAKVYLSAGTGYCEGGDGFMRFNIACPRAVLAEALRRICRMIAAL